MKKLTKIQYKAIVLLAVMSFDLILPLRTLALTSGPSQPEVQSFEPVGTSEMVDVFSGDFNYNIPLMDVNGYPINIAYHAGISADQEASWVGLGWNINPGNINRNMRGLPDDMNGEEITQELNLKDNVTYGIELGASFEIFGKESANKISTLLKNLRNKLKLKQTKYQLGLNVGFQINNYKGVSFSLGQSLSAKGGFEKLGLNAGLSNSFSDNGGIDVGADFGLEPKFKKGETYPSFTIGGGFNSKAGTKGMNIQAGISSQGKKQKERGNGERSTIGPSGMYNFNTMTYIPRISTPLNTFSANLNFKVDPEFMGLAFGSSLSGFYTKQKINEGDKWQKKKAYGYMYEQNANRSDNMEDRDYLLDFNRGNNLPLMEQTPYLPWANHTYDVYSVSAQGVGGTYHAFRNDLPVLHDDYKSTKNREGSIGVEFGALKAFHVGSNFGYNQTKSEAGAWLKKNHLAKRLGFVSNNQPHIARSRLEDYSGANSIGANLFYESIKDPEYEPVYFKETNEITPQVQFHLDRVGGDELVRPNVYGKPKDATVSDFLYVNDSTAIIMDEDPLNNVSIERNHRNKLFEYITAADAQVCLDQGIKNIGINSLDIFTEELPTISTEPRISLLDDKRKASHISEVRILNNDGSRHVFGIPAYNNIQVEKSFRINHSYTRQDILDKGMAWYFEQEASTNNQQGIDNYYSSTTTPAYAHSYLLTGVLSPDYVDLTGDGISDDDLGSAVKMNYSRVHEAYRWRVPIEQNFAKYAPGLKADVSDDVGNVIYGEKEVWHLHSIEGKTHVAVFEISTRYDALGVKGDMGGADETQTMYKLDKIKLYSKRELKVKGENAIPIKTVHFEYDYTLCPGVPNQINPGEGKLTLKKIYFTYGKSNKGKLNSYKFNYSDNNPAYHLNAYDRWGTYASPVSEPSNADYPYTTSDKDSADYFASAWNLSQIQLPSGGVINVDYESDDYAYVQNHRAMNMYKVVGFGNSTEEYNAALYATGKDNKQYDYVFFELPEELPTGEEGKKILRHEYLPDIDDLQITVNTEVRFGKYEYVKAYVKPSIIESNGEKLIDCGVTSDGTKGYIKMIKQEIRNRLNHEDVNPVVKVAWQFVRMNLGYLVSPVGDRRNAKLNDKPSWSEINSFKGIGEGVKDMLQGPEKRLEENNFCRIINPNKSWIRLRNHNKNKLGGGHRVKKISMNDNWSAINSGDTDSKSSTYGQEYDYTKKENSSVDQYQTISSGVATYEPQIGSDENPFVVPHHFDQENPGIPDTRYTFEHPVAESFMPGASIGYSKVTVRSIQHSQAAKRQRTGYQVSEFYTSKDFPTIIKSTELNDNSTFINPKFSFPIIYQKQEKGAIASQGFYVELNDMHGKPSVNASYDEYDRLVSGARYEYQLDEKGKLDNEVKIILPNGDIEKSTMGVNIDFALDFTSKIDQFKRFQGEPNLDVFTIGFLPIPAAVAFFKYSDIRTDVKTAVATKVVHKKGILKKVIALKEGSEIATENLLYDSETGQVLLTAVQNEFHDSIYTFNYPAHWAYDDGMGLAFKNWGLEVSGISMEDGELASSESPARDLYKYLYNGDVAILNREGVYKNKKVWVRRTLLNPVISQYKIWLIDESGNVLAQPSDSELDAKTTLRIIQSGRNNMASSSIGSVQTFKNPIKNVSGGYDLTFSGIINSSAVVYKEEWKTQSHLFPKYDCVEVPTGYYDSFVNHLTEYVLDSGFYNQFYYSFISNCVNSTQATNIPCNYTKFSFPDSRQEPEFIELVGVDNYLIISDSFSEITTQDNSFPGKSEYYADSVCSSTIQETANCNIFNYHYIGKDPNDNFTCYLVKVELWRKCKTYFDQFFYSDELGTYAGDYSGYYLGNLQDSTYIFRTTDSTYFGFKNLELLRNSNNIIRSFTKDVVDTTSFSFSQKEVKNYDQFTLQSYKNGESSCKFQIYTKGVFVKDILQILDDEPTSDTSMRFQAEYVDHYGDTSTAWFDITTDCGNFLDCEKVCEGTNYAQKVNPFLRGLRGNWRPHKSYTYVHTRKYFGQSRPEMDGEFSYYWNFWSYSSSNKKWGPTTFERWVNNSEITEYSPLGMELENVDPLGRYSAARYGYSQTLPTAVGSNMQHRQLWYESFEEYTYLNSIASQTTCPQEVWAYDSTMNHFVDSSGNLDNQISHSGNMSLHLTGTDSFCQEVYLNPTWIDTITPEFADKEYITSEDDEILPFRPQAGEYLLSAWVRENESAFDTLFENSFIRIEFVDEFDVVTTHDFYPQGQIIEGWQRVNSKFSVPSGAKIMRVKYMADNVSAWFDDLRIHPYNGNAKTYAYDFRTLRLMAEMDENNFATFYEYDLEGNLVRVKKETVKGIKSLQENRQHQKENQ